MSTSETPLLEIRPSVAAALREGRPVVALESTLIAHGLPWPMNLETALQAESAIRDEGAMPATIAVLRGRPTIGLAPFELEHLARGEQVVKASRRDLGIAVAQGRTAATTVAATMMLARKAGIRLFATGGIGGAHRLPDRGSPADPGYLRRPSSSPHRGGRRLRRRQERARHPTHARNPRNSRRAGDRLWVGPVPGVLLAFER